MPSEEVRAPSPRRVAAGRRNRLLRKGLTPLGREKLRQAARKNRPWIHATGPRTPVGKARVALNGKRFQRGSLSYSELRQELGQALQLVQQMAACRRLACRASGGTR